MQDLLVGVDLGTHSARAGVFDRKGRLLGRAEAPIAVNRPQPDHAEHDSEDIWRAVCTAVRTARAQAGADPRRIVGIGFDATCSLVVRGKRGEQISVSTTHDPRWDTIVWLDHRAVAQAQACTATRHRVLDFIGGVMSPEMQVPKLMWLKRNLPACWGGAGYFFDLADYLTWKASGCVQRSQCTLTCKWTFLAHEDRGWQHDFLAAAGIPDMLAVGKLPEQASPIGAAIGSLTQQAADELGLTVDCCVGTGLIDAHAGTLGVLGACAADGKTSDRHLALIAGTSTCVMALARQPRAVPGVWGPYYGAVLPDLWLNEGGQSATGAALDHIVRWHSAGGEPNAAMHQAITERVMALRRENGADFAARLHVLPDFHGNRSPLADPHALGVISGLTLDSSFDDLCRLYWRTAVGIALGVRHILDALDQKGYAIDTLHVTGGHLKNPLLMELYADATGCTLVEAGAEDAVLLGAAMVAAKAAGLYGDLASAATGMQQAGRPRAPDANTRARYDRDYGILLQMQAQRSMLDAMR